MSNRFGLAKTVLTLVAQTVLTLVSAQTVLTLNLSSCGAVLLARFRLEIHKNSQCLREKDVPRLPHSLQPPDFPFLA